MKLTNCYRNTEDGDSSFSNLKGEKPTTAKKLTVQKELIIGIPHFKLHYF